MRQSRLERDIELAVRASPVENGFGVVIEVAII
jgi:hypothetical protein